ncbi:MAG: hypothetical protein AAF713_05545 [Pseudomonadota bacterium]
MPSEQALARLNKHCRLDDLRGQKLLDIDATAIKLDVEWLYLYARRFVERAARDDGYRRDVLQYAGHAQHSPRAG